MLLSVIYHLNCTAVQSGIHNHFLALMVVVQCVRAATAITHTEAVEMVLSSVAVGSHCHSRVEMLAISGSISSLSAFVYRLCVYFRFDDKYVSHTMDSLACYPPYHQGAGQCMC
jgi:hypothetical protein